MRYLGAYRLDPHLPYVRADAPVDLRKPQELRSTLVFRLLALDGPPPGVPATTPAAEQLERRRVDPHTTWGTWQQHLEPAPAPAQRTEVQLLHRYQTHARSTGQSEFTAYRIKLPASVTELAVDLFDITRNELVVARPTTARPAVWSALGELNHLARYFDPAPARGLLLPSEPGPDLTALLLGEGVSVTWPAGAHGFTRPDPAN